MSKSSASRFHCQYQLNIFYGNFDNTLISQTPKVTGDVVLCTVGRLISLLLGVSLLSFGGVFELLFSVAKIVITSKFTTVITVQVVRHEQPSRPT